MYIQYIHALYCLIKLKIITNVHNNINFDQVSKNTIILTSIQYILEYRNKM